MARHGGIARGRSRFAAALALLLALGAAPARAAGAAWPPEALEFRDGSAWQRLWPGPVAPSRWATGSPALARAVRWRASRPGMQRAELQLRVVGAPWAMRALLVRVEPRRFRFRLERRSRDAGTRGDWTVDDAPASAALACNAGQFALGDPWGWLVRAGREEQPPGRGPLSAAVCVDTGGRMEILPPGEIARRREAAPASVSEAFQSYPAVLGNDGEVPAPWLGPDSLVDALHRDSRFALGLLRDGRVVFVLTRLATPAGALDALPIGPTSPEMAALMGALGCARAVLLDGGISGQLLARDARGRKSEWRGLRRVPLGLVLEPR